jgi:hypothetical protein
MKRATFYLLAALLAFCIPARTHAQTDDFNDGNDTGWLRYNPVGVGTWSFPNGGCRLQAASTGNPQNPGRAGSVRNDTVYTNFYISIDITNWNNDVSQSAGILARISDPGLLTTDGYAFTWDRGNATNATSGDVDISRIDNEAPTGLTVSGSDAIHFTPGRTYRLVFIGIDATLEGRIYEHPNLTNPVIRVVASDTTHTAGKGGLVVYANNTNATPDTTFDNYFAAESEPIVPPNLMIERVTADALAITWATNATGFTLQFTPNLSANPRTWTDVPFTEIFEEDGRYRYFEFTSGAPLFFRLRRPPN